MSEPPANPAGEKFDAYYYAHGCNTPYRRDEAWLAMFDYIGGRILEEFPGASILDAGCAIGLLVERLRKGGAEAYGIDISEYAISQVHPDIRPYVRVGSITEPFERRYDLIVSIEVLEHMDQAASEQALANLCAHTDDILFSSTPFDYKEVTHYNVQPPEYWAEQFARRGFFRDVDFDASFLTPWAARFRRRSPAGPPHRLVRDYERKFWLLWKENGDLRALVEEQRRGLKDARQQAAAQQAEADALRARWQALESSRTWKLLTSLRRLSGKKG